jgi:selenocysteine lyase/cysteine desulfurase
MEGGWDELRATEFPVSRHWAYLDHAAVAPLPRRAGDALRAWAAEQENHGVIHWGSWEEKLEAIRDRIAILIGAEREEIAFVNSTTQGIGLVAEGFPWEDGDNVVVPAEEYPSNIYPWMNLATRGVSVRLVPSRDGRIWPEDLEAAMDRRTRVLAISHVEFASGFRNDLDLLGELCRRRGVALFVDAIQGLGPFTYDVRRTPIDFLAADGHKWLLGPEGAGLLFIHGDWIDRLRPIGVGWHSVVGSYNSPEVDFRLKPSAQRWEGGSFNMPGIQALGASLGLIHEIGPDAVSRRILERAASAREQARRAGWRLSGSTRSQDHSGIVAIEHEDVPAHEAAKALRARGVALCARRGRLRISPHIYNNDDDLNRLREALIACRESPRVPGRSLGPSPTRNSEPT